MERDDELPPREEEKTEKADAKKQEPKPKSSDEHEFTDWALI